MTFIVGFKCTDGLVLCSDTQESDGVTKKYRQKLEAMTIGDWGICWAGTGAAFTVDKFSDKLKEVLGVKDYNRAAIESDIELCLDFVRQSYAAEHGISIVLGLFGSPLVKPPSGQPYRGVLEFNLYRGSSSTACISPEKDYCCAGMDVTLANFVLSNTAHRFIHLEYAKRLGIFVTSLMKIHAEGVGGQTTVFCYRIGSPGWLPLVDREVNEIEAKIPPVALDEAVTRFWVEQPLNRDFDELTRSYVDKLAAEKKSSIRPSTFQTSKDRQ